MLCLKYLWECLPLKKKKNTNFSINLERINMELVKALMHSGQLKKSLIFFLAEKSSYIANN